MHLPIQNNFKLKVKFKTSTEKFRVHKNKFYKTSYSRRPYVPLGMEKSTQLVYLSGV